ncbi:ABC transporter permease [Fibrivirga algicola]|uniref:FtsX-like permease family protein n=1 Tax=Fibrivirga algicola TaxID=2950420 RepID=A0ABX0QIH2_9BACT|nr:ABC transporter permease [Fibrivirga algicola]ARK09753.1 ABC transporter [Fibrella sp. ES10-3-2-2]NID10663.1 FtsX-like permease family protein [Fibrivirga algicola]
MKVVRQIIESLRFAWQSLRSNLLRTTLSLLGVTIGIFAIIAVFTIVDSLQRNIKDTLGGLGSNVIYVQKWPFEFGSEYRWWKYFQRPEPTYNEYRLLSDRLENAQAVVAMGGRGGITVKNGSNSLSSRISGVTYDYNKISDVPIAQGRYFAPQEMESSRNVTIIGSEIAETLFPTQSPIGQSMQIAGLKFVVIGVGEKKGASILEIGGNPDLRCIIPYGTFAKLFSSNRPNLTIAIKGYETDAGLENLEGEIKGVLRARRSLRPAQEDSFAINRPEALAKFISGIFAVLTIAGWFIGGFSMLVGGFGIANIMFVSVKERTNIIGIQKSLGAKNYVILLQFLFEAVLLAVVGGLVGIGLVYLMSFMNLGSLDIQLSASNIILGLAVSGGIGTIFGILPAALAARMNPVDAIRSK